MAWNHRACDYMMGDVQCGKPAVMEAITKERVRYLCDKHRGAGNQIEAHARREKKQARLKLEQEEREQLERAKLEQENQ